MAERSRHCNNNDGYWKLWISETIRDRELEFQILIP